MDYTSPPYTSPFIHRGIDNASNLVDVRLSEIRDMEGTKTFCAQVIELHDNPPNKVATDGSASYPHAIVKDGT